MFVNSKDFSRNLTIFSKSAAPCVVIKSKVYFFFTAKEISLLTSRANTTYMCAVIRYNSLSDFPICHFLANLYNLSGKLESTDCSCFDFKNNVLWSTCWIRYFYHSVTSEFFSESCDCFHFHNLCSPFLL